MSATAARFILVVDDDYDIGEALTDVLRQEGHCVQWARSGIEALDLLERCGLPPSLILLDLMMPDLDGAGFRNLQLQRPQIAGVPVVVVSASSRIVDEAAALGVAAWIRKPFTVDELLAVVRDAMP